MILSILIPTIPEHAEPLKRLMAVLQHQIYGYKDNVEIIIDDRGKHITTGEKRNYLIHQSEGEYIIFIDSDDMIMQDYINKIVLAATTHNPDCITFKGFMTINGINRQNFVIQLGEKYEERNNIYYRWPNHLCAMKRDLIKDIKFPHVHFGEDYQWSKIIRDKGILKTEFHINDYLYHYDYKTKEPQQQKTIRHRRNWR